MGNGWYILTEDSRMGLVLWALINSYVFDNFFELRFTCPENATRSIKLEDINNWKMHLKGPDGKYLDAGKDKLGECLDVYAPGDNVILAIDGAAGGAHWLSYYDRVTSDAVCRGVNLYELKYNCSAEILLGFSKLKEWCAGCPFPDFSQVRTKKPQGVSLTRLWEIIDEINARASDGLLHYQRIPDWRQVFRGMNTENALENLLNWVTSYSRLWYQKGRISDCWAYDCCSECPQECHTIHGFVGPKWKEIFRNSLLFRQLQEAVSKVLRPIIRDGEVKIETQVLDEPLEIASLIKDDVSYSLSVPPLRFQCDKHANFDWPINVVPVFGENPIGEFRYLVILPIENPQYYLAFKSTTRDINNNLCPDLEHMTPIAPYDILEVDGDTCHDAQELAKYWDSFNLIESGENQFVYLTRPVKLIHQNDDAPTRNTYQQPVQAWDQQPQSTAPAPASPGQAQPLNSDSPGQSTFINRPPLNNCFARLLNPD